MHGSVLSVAAAAALTAAVPLAQDSPDGVLSLPIDKGFTASHSLARRHKSKGLDVKLENTLSQYLVTLQVGTPAQSVQASIDTGSWDLWFYSNSYKDNNFDETKSSTYQVIDSGGFDDTYNTESWNTGDWAVDNVGVGGATIQNQPFGVVTNGSNYGDHGILGVGLYTNQSSDHPNVPYQLKDQGLIKRNAFSLFLNSYDQKSGSIIFGGIDTAKFSGKLVQAEFHGDDWHGPDAYLLDIVILGKNTSALFDSGYLTTRLPSSVWTNITGDLNSTVSDLKTNDDGDYYVDDISSVPNDRDLTITIAGHDFDIPWRALFGDYKNSGQQVLLLEDAESEDERIIMGDAVLRALYLVYDLDGHSIYVGKARYTRKSKVKAIAADGLPSKLVANR